MPGAIFQKISKFSKNCLRHSPRHSLRANKNLHIPLRRLKICIKTPSGYALGYASGKILKISNFLKYSPRLYPQATPEGK
ncbi:hypothetical protein T06_2033 [Trichinella sp. T6]|nr:hypothetical protein T06_2033 [Trichinella sp. T6]